MTTLVLIALVAGGLVAGGPGSTGAQVPCARQLIDGFTQPVGPNGPVVSGSAPNDRTVASGLTDVVGNERDSTLTLNQAGSFSITPASTTASGGELYWSHGAGVISTGSLTWDGPDGDADTVDATGLGGVDYTGEGSTGVFRFEITAYDRPATNTPFTLEVYTNGGASSTQTITPVAPTAGTLIEFPISGFTPLAGAGADFSDVGAIILRFGPPDFASLDMTFGAVSGPCAPEVGPPPTDPPSTTAPPEPPVSLPPDTSAGSSGPVSGSPTFTG